LALQRKFAEAEAPFAVERALVGEHPAIVKLRALIERVAPAEVTVRITGESGTGKEVVAQAIHALSPRCNQPFVPVNCAAIPHELLESEMFGHERGAFTGAAGSRHGLLTTADRGTIFLDEIGEMPGKLQAKLLRVLEDGVVRPVGADRATRVNVRVIAASNVDLAEAVAQGKFREDLFYRLQVVPIVIAPLRERRSDIPLLVEHFLERIRERPPGREIAISREAMVALWSYDWPGNVRELENMVERLAILCEDSTIDTSILPENLMASARPATPPIAVNLKGGGLNLNNLVRELEGSKRRAQTNRREQTGGGAVARAQADDIFREAEALRRDSSGVFGRKRGRLDGQGIVWMKQSGRHR